MPAAVFITDVVGLIVLLGVFYLIRRRLLTIAFGFLWFMTITVSMTIVTIPATRHLWIHLSSLLFQSPPYLVAMAIFVMIFLLYESVVISVLQRQVRDIVQFVALFETKDQDKASPAGLPDNSRSGPGR